MLGQEGSGIVSRVLFIGVGVLTLILVAGCQQSDEKISELADARVATALAGISTATRIPTATPQPTATPLPTATPITLPPDPTPQPTATPIILPPDPTPQPTATPVRLPPTPTAQPTATPQPTPTPVRLLPTATPQPTFNDVWLKATLSVFMIETGFGTGSGWLIERGLILTNEHVVEGARTVLVYQMADPVFVATVIAVDRERDIALLRFDPDTAPLPVYSLPLPTGEISANDAASPLMAMGYSGVAVKSNGTVGSAAANVGVLSQVTVVGDTRELKIDAPVDPGDSGGPILNLKGEVVGMVRAAQEQTASGQRVVGSFFAVHIDEIRIALPWLKWLGGLMPTPMPIPTPTPIPIVSEAHVTRVFDGDTFGVMFRDGSLDVVRLLGGVSIHERHG